MQGASAFSFIDYVACAVKLVVLLPHLTGTMDTVDMEMDEGTALSFKMDLSSSTTTIDPSVVSSRILQSASLQKDQALHDSATDDVAAAEQPHFPRLSAHQASGSRSEYRRVRCPPHRYTKLREHWESILTPLVEYLKLQVRRSSACALSVDTCHVG